MFGRRTRTLLPTSSDLLLSQRDREVKERIHKSKDLQSFYYDRNAKSKPVLSEGQTVRFKFDDKDWKKGEVEKTLPYRSYIVRTEDGSSYRRNRRHVRFSNEPPIVVNDTDVETDTSSALPVFSQRKITSQRDCNQLVSTEKQSITTRSGRVVKKPARYSD